MANRHCWHCGAFTQMIRDTNSYWKTKSGNWVLNFSLFRCASCQRGSIGCITETGSVQASFFDTEEGGNRIDWIPLHAVSTEFPDVPPHIGGAAQEATGCLSVGHNRAAVLLARSVVEATAKDLGIGTGTLAKKIDTMHSAGRIREHTRDAAHEIRFLGNEMAHGDFTAEVDPEEAEDVLNLMSEILDEIYQGPARLNKKRQARLARSQPQTQTTQDS
ncbi:DUF4145 domain-containing protein [Nocardia salmonicida]|uniref:DUF4145 domain-containing protein n=1 Tax=Nocardia salmonicida TaxID=53431 RepID=UPI003414644C